MRKPTNFLSASVLSLLALLLVLMSAPTFADSYEEALTAARRGNTKQLVGFLERGLSPDTVDEQGNTLLILATMEGHAKTVKALLNFRPDVSLRNTAGDNAIMIAALKGSTEIFDMLLAAGAPINNPGWSPLLYAAFEGHVDIVDRLLASGADVNALSPNKSNALMVAARNGHIEVVRRLLATSIDLDQTNDRGQTAASWARSNGNTDIIDLIVAERRKRGPGQPKAVILEIN